MIHLKVYDIDGSFLWEGDYNKLPRVGLTIRVNGRLMRVVEAVKHEVTVMESEQ